MIEFTHTIGLINKRISAAASLGGRRSLTRVEKGRPVKR